jgi:hypothetical protein
MTYLRHTRTAAGLVLGAMLALGALASPASARWYGNGQYHDDDRRYENHYNGYNYQPPPVYYSTPYNYGYQAPPVYYDNTPGFTIRIF